MLYAYGLVKSGICCFSLQFQRRTATIKVCGQKEQIPYLDLMARKFLIGLFLSFSFLGTAQLPDGAIAPDFTVTDLNGNTHNLYDYLDQGIHVILDFGASWCNPCWNYHQSGVLEELYTLYGPDGTNEVMVFLIEGDGGTNEACLYGTSGCNGGTTGDWVTGTNYPIVNLEEGNLGIVDDYNIQWWPTVYIINSDHNTVWETGGLLLSSWELVMFESFVMDANPNVINGSCDDGGTIELNPSGGAMDFLTFMWSNGSTDEDAVNLSTGLYSVTVTDLIEYFEVFENIYVESDDTDLEIISEWENNISCFGEEDGSIELSVASSSSVSYFWSNGMTGNLIENLPTGVYDVTIVNDSNGCEIYGAYFVDEPDELYIEANGSDASCDSANGTIDYFVDGGVTPYQTFLEGGLINENPITNLPEGVYNLEILDANDCLISLLVNIGNTAGPTLTISTPDNLNCMVSSTLIDASNSVGSNLEFSWFTSTGLLLGNDESIVVTDEGIYYCELIDLITGCTDMESVVVQANFEMVDITLSSPDTLNCLVSSTLLDASNSTGSNLEFSWYDSEGLILGNEGSVVVNSEGIYYCELTNLLSGCMDIDSVVVISDFNLIEITIADPEVIECENQTITLEIEVSGDVVAYWFTENGEIVQGENTFTPEISSAGTYYFQGTSLENGCVSLDSVLVLAIDNEPAANFNYILDGISLSIEDLSTGSGLSYLIDYGDGNTSTDISAPHTYSEAGVYEVCLEVMNACGQSIACKMVFVGGAPEFDSELTQISCFGENDGRILIAPTSGVPELEIVWEGTGGFTSNAFMIENLLPGVYSMVLSDATGAFVESSFTIEDALQIILTSSVLINDENGQGLGSIELMAEGGTGLIDFLWEDGTEGPIIEGLSEGEYSVEAIDENGCRERFVFVIENILTSSQNIEALLGFEIFPNPASDKLQVLISLKKSMDIQLELFDINGKRIQSDQWNSSSINFEYDTNGLASGIYVLKLSSGNGSAFQKLSVVK